MAAEQDSESRLQPTNGEDKAVDVLVESAFEVESGVKTENVLAGLVSEVEVAQEVVMSDATEHSSRNEGSKKVKREAEGAMQQYAYQSLLHLEKHTVQLTDSLHKMCCLCNDGLSLHQQSIQDLHGTVDKCSKNLFTFISRLDNILEHLKSLKSLEQQIQTASLHLSELESLVVDT